jgi:hypothetical protein
MNRSVQIVTFLLVPLLFGCTAPQTPVVTLPQKLGIPQAFTTIRDARLNFRGNRPQREWKPPLKRISDPANLASELPGGAPMPKPIQVAAKIKQAEDLSEQKIKGLKYLGMIGCGCYDKDGDIQAAFLEALQDCTPCVRLAAIDALKITTDPSNRCSEDCLGRIKEVRERRFDRRFDRRRENCKKGLKRLCNSCGGEGCRLCACQCSSCSTETYDSGCSCGGHGCDVCNLNYHEVVTDCGYCGGSGCTACMPAGVMEECHCGGYGCHRCRNRVGQGHCQQGFGVCNTCGGGGCGSCGFCGTCLGKEICEQLEKMAYEQDKEGCWIEPMANIRAAAAELLSRCQLFPEEPTPAEDDGKEGPPAEDEKQEGPTPEDEVTKNGPPSYDQNAATTDQTQPKSYSFGDNVTSRVNYQGQPGNRAQQSGMVQGVVTPYGDGTVIIDLEDSYLLPVNSSILIQDSETSSYTFQVTASEVGRLQARPASNISNPFVERRFVHIGILAQ